VGVRTGPCGWRHHCTQTPHAYAIPTRVRYTALHAYTTRIRRTCVIVDACLARAQTVFRARVRRAEVLPRRKGIPSVSPFAVFRAEGMRLLQCFGLRACSCATWRPRLRHGLLTLADAALVRRVHLGRKHEGGETGLLLAALPILPCLTPHSPRICRPWRSPPRPLSRTGAQCRGKRQLGALAVEGMHVRQAPPGPELSRFYSQDRFLFSLEDARGMCLSVYQFLSVTVCLSRHPGARAFRRRAREE